MKHAQLLAVLAAAALVCGCSTTIRGLRVDPKTNAITVDQYTSSKDLLVTYSEQGAIKTWSLGANASTPTRAFFDGAAKLVETGAKLAVKP